MALNINLLMPLLIAQSVKCDVPECKHDHERLLDFSEFTGQETMLYLCRKHYEDFSKAARRLP